MLSTLFFDEVDASSALHVRTTCPNLMNEEHAEIPLDAFASHPAWGCCSSGSIPIPSLRATLLWWLDRDAPLVHVMLTSSSPGDVSYSCRKMSVEVPFPRQTIIACGVTHVREGTTFSITWVTSHLEAGLLRIQLQRIDDHHSQLLLVPDGKTVLTSSFSKVVSAFKREAEGRQFFANDEFDNEKGGIGISLSACIIASLSPEKSSAGLVSMILLTNGFSLWRVNLGENGTFTEDEFCDPKGHTGSTEEFARGNGNGKGDGGGSNISSWLPFWPWDGKRGAQRRYLNVSAVQQTEYIALLRCNGSLELYDGSLCAVSCAPTCALSRDEMLVTKVVRQWAKLEADDVHVVTCFGSKGVSRCIWSRIPIASLAGVPSIGQTMTIVPPTASDSLVGCVTIGSTCLNLLWDVAAEENTCMRSSISVGSLMHSSLQGLSGILQVIRTRDEIVMEVRTRRAASAHPFLEGANSFFCHSRTLHAITSVGEELVLIEGVAEGVRAHVLATEMNPIEHLVEAAFAVGGPVIAATRNTLSLNAIHLIPTVVSNDDRSPYTGTAAFEEGVDLAASCADGADNLAALMISAVQSVPVALTLGGFQLLRSAAHLQGYIPSGYVDDVVMAMAVEHASTKFNLPSRQTSFCSFSRRFIQHTVSRDLLSRIAYLLCSYIGWMGCGVACATSLELPRIRIIFEFLSAAYHAVSVAGPFTASIVPNVSETVIADVINLFLQFKPQLGDEGDDALFVVHVANRLWECDGVMGPQACATWCKLLSRRHPCLQHFLIMRDIKVGRTTRSAQLSAMSLSVSFHLTRLPAPIAVSLLLDICLSPSGKSSHHTTFANVDVAEWQTLLTDTSLVAQLYRFCLLRRFLYTCGAHHASVSGSLVRELFLTDLVELEQYVQLSDVKLPGVHRALVEVHLETHMFLARAALDEPRFDDVLHSLEEALRRAAELDMVALYTEQALPFVSEMVKLATSSQELTDSLVSLTHSNTELCGIIAAKWYAYTSRMPSKRVSSEADAMRLRSARGLFRYLCRRHAYGQAGRMMTEIATAIRCSSLRQSVAAAVVEITALAVTAVELIAPTAPLHPHLQQEQEYDRESSLLATHGGSVSWSHTPEFATPKGPLSSEHLPWLRRRHYQAICEQKLLEANRHVDCTDLWVENPPSESYAAAVKRFVNVLIESRFWKEALRFASMTGYNVSVVLQEHVLDLLSSTDYTVDEEALDEWYELIESCEEFSSLLNRYGPLRSTVAAALLFDCEKTHPALLGSLERADRYEAMQALLEVFETLRHRWESALAIKESSTASEEVADETSLSIAQQCGSKSNSAALLWLPLVEALRIGTGVFADFLHGSKDDPMHKESAMTAGVFDPMACRAQELLDSLFSLDHPSLEQARSIAEMFLQSFEEVKRRRLVAAQ